MEDFKVRYPSFKDMTWETSYITYNKFMDKFFHIQQEIETYAVMQAEFEDVIVFDLIPELKLALRQFYQVKDMNEFIGINQEFRENVLKMVRMAKNNIDLIYEKYHKYQDPIRAKRFRSLSELEDAIRKNFDEYKNNPTKEEEIDSLFADQTVELLKKCQEKARIIRRNLNTFIKEEISVIRLGSGIWHRSQVDFTVEDEEKLRKKEKDDAEIAKNTELNRIRRQMITDINLSRSRLQNATDGADTGKSRQDKNKVKNIPPSARVEL